MKSEKKKRLLAVVLCMVIVLSNSSFISASAETEQPAAVSEESVQQDAQEAGESAAGAADTPALLSETAPEETPEATSETTQTPEVTTESTQASEVTVEPEVSPAPESTPTPTSEATTAPETTPDQNEELTQTPEPASTPTSEANVEPEVTSTEIPMDEAQQTELQPYHEVYDDDTITITVSAEAGIIPAGAELKVTPIEKKEITNGMTEEEKAEAEAVNDQYDLTEKKLTEDSEANDTMMQGFLAYDISFLVNGQETEPNGDVKVVMDFKEAALPEGVSEDADVTVKHLREEVIAEDGVVVEDITESVQLEATEKAEIEQVTFTSALFSVYTITWSGDVLKIKIVDAYGSEIGSNNGVLTAFEWNNEKTVTVDDVVKKIRDKCTAVREVKFNKAVYSKNGQFSFTDTQINSFKYKSTEGKSEFRYNPKGDLNKWNTVGEGAVIYFIFGDDPTLNFTPITTVSTKDTIDINLFDYQVENDGDESADWNSSSGINKDHVLKFVDSKGENNKNININQTGGSGYINSGMVQNKLNDEGFPVLSKNETGSDGSNLNYLFDDNTQENVKNKYTDLDHLFKIDNDGYHVFNSADNYAYLPYSDGGFLSDFTVGNIDDQSSAGFYPFSQPTYSTLADIKNSSEEAVLGYTGVNHYYGMTIETTFIQPKGGKITTTDGETQDMIFEFSGDDDVWVFIDDVLVLDLGGIHGAVSGTINFATGRVTRTDIDGTSVSGTNIRNAFNEAGVSGDLEAGTNTFSDYTTHTIKFFYLERGNVDSNCMIKFNFPTIPKDSIAVAKEVTDENGNGTDYAEDINFEFNLKVSDSDYSNQEYTLWENGKQVLDEEGNPVTGTTDNNGNFTLKHSQMAVFSELDATTEYWVTELGAYLDGYAVTVDDTSCTINKDTSGEEIIYSATTGNRTVGDDASVVFKNAIKDRTTLNIEKELAAGEQSTEDTFQVRVKIQGELYTGTYSIEDGSGYTAQNGIINLKAGQTASISGLPYGASFEVEEVLDGSYLPTYTITGGGIYDKEIPTDSNELSAVTGKITGEGGMVTVINSKVVISDGTTKVTVTKTWDEEAKYADLIPDSIIVTLYEDTNHNQKYDSGEPAVTKDANGNTISAQTTLSKDNWTHTWSNLPADTDFVITETYPEGFEWKTTEYSNDLSNLIKLDRVTSCKNTEFNLGKNNMLLVKKTENDGYFLWSVYDLKLTDAQIQEIAQVIMNMNLEGSGNLNLNNLGYDWGITQEDHGITLSETDTGWHLEFDKTSVWSQFWNFQYDRTENISLVNQINSDLTTEVKVNKEWIGKDPRDNVTVKLIPTIDGQEFTAEQIGWNGEVSVTLDGNCEWKHTYQNLPYYYYDTTSETYKKIVYTVTETGMNDDYFEMKPGEVVGDYIFEVRTNGENDFTIINTRVDRWAIYKVSSTDDMLPLEDAEFTLTKTGESTPKYKGKSDLTGKVAWYTTSGEDVLYLEDGVYELEETKAPSGYQKSDEIWIITVENSALISITREDGSAVDPMTPKTREAEMVIRYAFTNTPLYNLPSAGGSGIFWYLISGTAFMMAASFILYRMKRKEVLGK